MTEPVDISRIPLGESIGTDGGPRYVETDFSRWIVEPCNAMTAFLFVLLVLYFVWRIRGRYRQHPFVCICMPILLAGGIGGTLYHGLRRYHAFFLLDVIPIGLLVLMGSIYLWVRLRPKWWHVLSLAVIVSIFPFLFVFPIVTHHVAIVIHYMLLALLILIPVAIVLVRTRFRYVNLIKLTLVCFGFAILFRFLDPVSAPILPGLGTHWLWHILGAITTGVLSEYFCRLETEPIAPLPWQAGVKSVA
jgi:hypothetical protein